MLNTLIAQELENLIKYHHFDLITVQNLDTCYLKAAKRLDLIGFDNSTCWYFPFKLHITISILHSWATSFSFLFYFFFLLEGANTSASEISSSVASACVPLLISEVKASRDNAWMNFQVTNCCVPSPWLWSIECTYSNSYYLCDHQTHVLAWAGVDCTWTWHNLMICLLDKKDAKKCHFLILCCRALCYFHQKIKIFFWSVQSQ